MKTKMTKKQIKEVVKNLDLIATYIEQEGDLAKMRVTYANQELERLLPIETIDMATRDVNVRNENYESLLRSLCCLIYRLNDCIQGDEIPVHWLRGDFYDAEVEKMEEAEA